MIEEQEPVRVRRDGGRSARRAEEIGALVGGPQAWQGRQRAGARGRAGAYLVDDVVNAGSLVGRADVELAAKDLGGVGFDVVRADLGRRPDRPVGGELNTGVGRGGVADDSNLLAVEGHRAAGVAEGVVAGDG